MTGGLGGGHSEAPQQQQQPAQVAPIDNAYGYQQQPQQQGQNPCDFEVKQFLNCAQSYELTLCEGFSDALKQCKLQHAMP